MEPSEKKRDRGSEIERPRDRQRQRQTERASERNMKYAERLLSITRMSIE